MNSFLENHKGKLVLLDFWVSRYGPCRQEIPDMQYLEKEYKNKNIAFVNISTDQKTSEWLRRLERNRLMKVEIISYFMQINPDVKQCKTDTIPRYVLIGRKGNITSDDAPCPSDPKLYT
jgi:thiol-disulfide isomerase/thioredoxin